MPNYKETTVTGQKSQRGYRLTIDNPFEGIPTVRIEEEVVTKSSDGTVSHVLNVRTLTETLAVNKALPIINPTTWTTTGEASDYQNLYVLLKSLYHKLATEEDARVETARAQAGGA